MINKTIVAAFLFTTIFMFAATPASAEIRIGALFASTGPAGYLGLPEKQTAEMLVEELNKAGGINGTKVKLISYDTQGDEARALNFFKRLATKDRVIAVIGPTRTGTTMAISPLAEQYKVPVISCAAGGVITTPVNPYVFKTAQSDDLVAGKIFEDLARRGIDTIAIITAQSGYGATGREALIRIAEKEGVAIVADERFRDTDNDMTSQLTKIKNSDAKATICWGVGPAPAIVTRNARQIGVDNIYMSQGVASPKFLELAGDAAEGIRLPAGRLVVADQLPDNSPFVDVITEYKKNFESTFNTPASVFGGHAYDAFTIVQIAIDKAGPEKGALVPAIESITGFVGIGGVFSFSATDHAGLTSEAFVMVEVKNGRFVLAE